MPELEWEQISLHVTGHLSLMQAFARNPINDLQFLPSSAASVIVRKPLGGLKRISVVNEKSH